MFNIEKRTFCKKNCIVSMDKTLWGRHLHFSLKNAFLRRQAGRQAG